MHDKTTSPQFRNQQRQACAVAFVECMGTQGSVKADRLI